jgi:hypothetical protein
VSVEIHAVFNPQSAEWPVPLMDGASFPVEQGHMPVGLDALLYMGPPALGLLCLAKWIVDTGRNTGYVTDRPTSGSDLRGVGFCTADCLDPVSRAAASVVSTRSLHNRRRFGLKLTLAVVAGLVLGRVLLVDIPVRHMVPAVARPSVVTGQSMQSRVRQGLNIPQTGIKPVRSGVAE